MSEKKRSWEKLACAVRRHRMSTQQALVFTNMSAASDVRETEFMKLYLFLCTVNDHPRSWLVFGCKSFAHLRNNRLLPLLTLDD